MKRVAVLGVFLALLLAGTAQGAPNYGIRLTGQGARDTVRASGGFVHACERIATRRFRCIATYWQIEHTAEEVEPGQWVEVSAVPVSEEATLVVSLYGVRRIQTPTV